MGIRVTDKDNVCLYDSTSGWAFGPIFTSEDMAEDFLTWCRVTHDVVPRNLTTLRLAELHNEWFDERVDPSSGYIKDDAPELVVPS